MKATEQFIRDAIEGGWKPESLSRDRTLYKMKLLTAAILDPEAWKAVGKVEQKDKPYCPYCNICVLPEKEELPLHPNCRHETLEAAMPWWRQSMHRMIDALAEGKTIEECLATITKSKTEVV